MKNFLLFCSLFLSTISNSQADFFISSETSAVERSSDYIASHQFEFDVDGFLNSVTSTSRNTTLYIDLPLSDGSNHSFILEEKDVLTGKMKEKYSTIKSYNATSTQDQYITGKIAISPNGLAGIIQTHDGDVFMKN